MDLEKLKIYSRQLRTIAEKYGITRIYIFGSIARGEAKLGSDIDFLVEMKDGASMFGVAGFCYESEQLLGARVDVIPKSILSNIRDNNFKANVQRDAVLL